jgi:histone acetyltransferase (RNA polymerase elongator complex component)
METDVRWNIKVSQETDRGLRTYLARKGMKKGSLSQFVENAVAKELLQTTVEEIRERNADMSAEEVEELVDEAVAWARKHK